MPKDPPRDSTRSPGVADRLRPYKPTCPSGIWQASNRTGEAHVIVVEPGDFQIQRLITNGIITHVA